MALQIIDEIRPKPREVHMTLTFTSPGFSLEPDLKDKKIGVRVNVNGKQESLVIDYEDFFAILSSAHGRTSLRSGLHLER